MTRAATRIPSRAAQAEIRARNAQLAATRRPMTPLPSDVATEIRAYLKVRAEHDRLVELEDRAFVRYMNGGSSASAASRAANRVSAHSADLASAEIRACRAVDSLPPAAFGTLDLAQAARLLEAGS